MHKRPAIGCAIFDHPSVLSHGWYSSGNGEAVRFASPSALPQSIKLPGEDEGRPIFWVTNADWAEYSNANLAGSGFVRLPSFFKVSLLMVANEIGIDLQSADMRDAAIQISKVMSRAWEFAQDAWSGLAPLENLQESFQEYLGLKDQPDFAFLEPFMASAYQENSAVLGRKWEPGSIKARLIPNRVRHVTNVLNIGIPTGKWSQRKDLKSIDAALSVDEPVFVECDINWAGAELADLCAYGTQSFGKNVAVRQWVAQPELLFLAEHAKSIKVSSAISWEAFTLPPQLPDVFFADNLTSLSYSAGIVAESFLSAISTRRYSKKLRRYFHPTRAVWMRSVDRAISFAQARRLYESGLRVAAYGWGAIDIDIFQHEIDEAKAIAADCGFMIMSGKRLANLSKE